MEQISGEESGSGKEEKRLSEQFLSSSKTLRGGLAARLSCLDDSDLVTERDSDRFVDILRGRVKSVE